MKKTIICTFLIAAGAFALLNVSPAQQEQSFGFQNFSALTLGYDKSMSEKTIKAAVIDSYFRNNPSLNHTTFNIEKQRQFFRNELEKYISERIENNDFLFKDITM